MTEPSVVELLDGLDHGESLDEVAGLAPRGHGSRVFRTTERRLIDDLDALPLVMRYGSHSRHLGVPFIPIPRERSCWGRCSYCSVTTAYRDARRHGEGELLRLRSREMIATSAVRPNSRQPMMHLGDPTQLVVADNALLLRGFLPDLGARRSFEFAVSFAAAALATTR